MSEASPSPIPGPGFYWARLEGDDRWQPVEVFRCGDGRLFVMSLGDEGNGHVVEWGPRLTPPDDDPGGWCAFADQARAESGVHGDDE